MWRYTIPLLVLLGCPSTEPEPEPTPPGSPATFAAAPPCASPTEGFDRLTEEGALRGVDLEPVPADNPDQQGQYVHPMLAHDLDGDGDVDLAFGQISGDLDLYVNDGDGHFEARPSGLPVELGNYGRVGAHAFADTDGDGLPELFRAGFGFAQVQRNLGGLSWGPPRVILLEPEGERAMYTTLALGDVDGDGDLDLLLPSLHGVFEFGGEDLPPGAVDRLFLHDDGLFSEAEALGAAQPGMSQLGLFTDRDTDGDLDLFVGADLLQPVYPPTSFYRNDGGSPPALVDDAADVGGAHRAQVMGADSWDSNGDGAPDYCFTVIGPILCLVSAGELWASASATWSLVPDDHKEPLKWTAWSVEADDLDHDGRIDLSVAAGKPDDIDGGGDDGGGDASAPWLADQPNGLFAGTEAGFEDRAAAVGFDSLEHAYGAATADVDGDGWLDVVVGYAERPPELWMNRCGPGAWLDVELRGAAGNAEGYGARVEVTTGQITRARELHALRTAGQGPSRLHFGLGDAETAEVRVHWPDGATTQATTELRGTLTVHHPDAP